MSKRTCFTTITPLPAGIPRESVLSTLHDHFEMIDLNPLVIDRHRSKPPEYALKDEYHATWYQITDKITYLPGAKSSVSYHGCFHDLADGLQTHVYAPAGLEIKGRWTLGGNLPGEPVQPVEIGLNIPRTGLYVREDVDMKCNILLTSFVRKTLKKAHAHLVERIVEKAHIEGVVAENERVARVEEWRQSSMSGTAPSDSGSLWGQRRPESIAHSDTGLSSHSSPSLASERTRESMVPPPQMQNQGYAPGRSDQNVQLYNHLPIASSYATKREDHLRGMGYGPQSTQAHPVELPAPGKSRADEPAELAG